MRCPWLLDARSPMCAARAVSMSPWRLFTSVRTLCVMRAVSVALRRPFTGVCAMCVVWCGVVWCAALVACPAVPPRALRACVSVAAPARCRCGACFPGSRHLVAVLLGIWSCALVVAGGGPL